MVNGESISISMVVNWMWVEESMKDVPKVSSLVGCMASDSKNQRGGVKRIVGG